MDYLVALIIYVVALSYFSWRNFQYPVTSDRLDEYGVFMGMVEGKPADQDTLNHCPLLTMPPYILWRFFKVPIKLAFRTTPGFFYALLPAFMFLIGREWFSVGYALLGVFVVTANFYVWCYTDTGRNSIAMGVLAGAYWAIVTGNIWLATLFLGMVVISHYGTAQMALFILGSAMVGTIIFGMAELQFIAIIYAIHITLIWVWQNLLAKRVGVMTSIFIIHAIRTDSIWDKDGVTIPGKKALTSLECRDPVLKAALGLTWKYMGLPQKLELITSWLLVAMIPLSLILSTLSLPLLLAYAAFVAIVISVVVPHVSKFYGIVRTQFTAMIFITPFIVMLIEKWNIGWLAISILALHCFLLSGVLHPLFGKSKYVNILREVVYE